MHVITVPIRSATHAQPKVMGNLDELGALRRRLHGMVRLQSRHAFVSKTCNEVNDAIACGMGHEGASTRLGNEPHGLDRLGIDSIDVAG